MTLACRCDCCSCDCRAGPLSPACTAAVPLSISHHRIDFALAVGGVVWRGMFASVGRVWSLHSVRSSCFLLFRWQAVYPFLDKLVAELTDLVPGSVFHLGGDEVQQDCWSGDPTIQAFIKSHNITIEQLCVRERRRRSLFGSCVRACVRAFVASQVNKTIYRSIDRPIRPSMHGSIARPAYTHAQT